MRQWTFLSLSPGYWLLSIALHLTAGTAVLYCERDRVLDLTSFDLDLAPIGSSMTVLSNPSVPEEDTWQKPWIASKPKMVPAPTPSQVVITVPPHALPAPAAVSSQDGNGTGFRSIAQVSRIPQFKFKSEPAYPETAKRANIEGVVILQVDIDATGAVKKVSVIKGLGYGCDEAAVEAMKQSSFTPAIGVNGEPEPIHIPETYLFKFNSDSE